MFKKFTLLPAFAVLLAAACATSPQSPKEDPNYDKEFLENFYKFFYALRVDANEEFQENIIVEEVQLFYRSDDPVVFIAFDHPDEEDMRLFFKKANSPFSAIYTNLTDAYTATLTNKSKGTYLIISNPVTGFRLVSYLTNQR